MLRTAYEMRMSDWSSDVCSSDLLAALDRVLEHMADRRATAVVDLRQRRRQGRVVDALGDPIRKHAAQRRGLHDRRELAKQRDQVFRGTANDFRPGARPVLEDRGHQMVLCLYVAVDRGTNRRRAAVGK